MECHEIHYTQVRDDYIRTCSCEIEVIINQTTSNHKDHEGEK